MSNHREHGAHGFHECGGCGRINNFGDDVCLCDMRRFRRERPDEYADLVRDGVIEAGLMRRLIIVISSAYWQWRS